MSDKSRVHPVILFIIAINILFYIYNAYTNGSDVLTGISPIQRLNVGGMSQGYGVWRIFTSLFVHASLFHLATNMIILYLLVLMIGNYISSIKLALIYLSTGFVGNAIGLLLTPTAVMCGASTAVFGVLGILIIKSIAERRNNSSQLILVLLLTFYLLFITFIDESTNSTLHISGLISGFMLVLLFKIIVIISPQK